MSNEYVMKFSPLQMIVGEINLGFEKRVDEMSSLEFELGPTFILAWFRKVMPHSFR